MKPRAFIGSSVEGLNIAYAVQQNLLYDAEITVWSQGVFQLTAGAVDSLIDILNTSDFGIFIFTPDDIATIRKASTPVVRDNVLFELGLFLGKLGRDRAFFLIPDNITDLHLPTDLLGITPGKYEGSRSDTNLQAATGPVCNQIRNQIKKIGVTPGRLATPSVAEDVSKPDADGKWFEAFLSGNHAEAQQLLELKLQKQSGVDRLKTELWLHFNNLKMGKSDALAAISAFCRDQKSNVDLIEMSAILLLAEGHADTAIQLIYEADEIVQKKPEIRIALADCYMKVGEPSLAERALDQSENYESSDVAVKLSEILEEQGKKDAAFVAIHKAYIEDSVNESIRYRFSRLALAMEKNEISSFLLEKLTRDFPKNSDYWGYFGNACYALRLYDRALFAYRQGVALGGNVQWILSNIGNLLSTKDLPTESIIYLEQSTKSEGTPYAFERLASAMKAKQAELDLLVKKCDEGLRQIRALGQKPQIQ
ncbi:TIR domain-containing protein [Curvibacter sp. PAE-UM]|uniref:TIR domain-containing protein n=1 Tax=Curvibacter sp. PAE-UM TaxID=1714344 RepID=UPI0009EC1F69|nr:TIR domain-containing protein [Curvibacter sp. PAE-UM]